MRSSRKVRLAAGMAALALCGAAVWLFDAQPGPERPAHPMRSLSQAAREAGDSNPQTSTQHPAQGRGGGEARGVPVGAAATPGA